VSKAGEMSLFSKPLKSIVVLIFLSKILSGNTGTHLEQVLGFSPTLMLWLTAILGDFHLPFYRDKKKIEFLPDVDAELQFKRFLLEERCSTILAISVGGALLPLSLALYQLVRVSPLAILLTSGIVAGIIYRRAVQAAGIGLLISNPFIAPFVGTIAAIAIALYQVFGLAFIQNIIGVETQTNLFELAIFQAIPVAFAGVILGVFVGLDLLHVRQFLSLNANKMMSFGGAGILDAIAVSGILAIALIYSLFALLY
jgi:uncharacterized membrane protein